MASGSSKVNRDDALRLARSKYLAGERIDIGQMAQELGINRVTLHRWVGTRDALLVEVVWPLAEVTMQAEWLKVKDLPGPRVPRLVGRHLASQLDQPGVRKFLLEENERAMRIFTHASYGYQPRLVETIRGYLALDVEEGRVTTALSLDELAYATLRIAESYAYLPTISGQDPDPSGAERVLEVFLRRSSDDR